MNPFKTRMLKKYFFCNNIHDKLPNSDDFFTLIEQELTSINTPCRNTYSNLILKVKKALSNLKNNQSIVIKPCHKGRDICIVNIRHYLSRIHTNLQDHKTYKTLIHQPTSAIANDAHTLIQYMHSEHIREKATMEFLLPSKNTHTSLFYRLPKIYKTDCPLHPVVSGCDGPTAHLSVYITHFIQPLASNLASHIKDTKSFANLIEKLPPLPSSPPMLSWSKITSRPYTQTF